MSQFGLIELTRQRQRASLMRNSYQDCTHCNGSGLVKTPDAVALDIVRRMQLAVTNEAVRVVEITVSPAVAELLLNRKRAVLHQLESQQNRRITIRSDAGFALDHVKFELFDHRMRLIGGPGR
jgi:ribonuclease E